MTCDWAERVLRGLTLRRKAAQLLMPRIAGGFHAADSDVFMRTQKWVREAGIGGVIIAAGPALDAALTLNRLQAAADVPLLVAADMEHGPGQVLHGGTILPYGFENGGATRFPPLMALGATGDESLAYELGRVTALEARAAGIHVAFAPVVDVNSNPANPIINTRSFGADPVRVGRMAAAHIRGVQEHGMLAVAKHFPGHGDTSVDSHRSLACLDADRERADAVELPPFRAAIAAGAAGIMSAHIAFPALGGDDAPATLSHALLQDLLRGELGFDGIIFTDALDMGAITAHFGTSAAAVRAVRAGVDVLLQPPPADVESTIDAIVRAVEDGELPVARIDDAVLRVLRAKQRLGLDGGASVDLNVLPERIGTAPHRAVARSAAERSITCVRNDAGVLPLGRARVLALLYSNGRDPFAGREFSAALRAGSESFDEIRIGPEGGADQLRDLPARAASADVVIVAALVHVSMWMHSLAIPEALAAAVNDIARITPVVLVAFGNPYILAQFPGAATYVVAWAQWEPAQTAAARALLGAVPMQGHLPIPLPPRHACGHGIHVGVTA